MMKWIFIFGLFVVFAGPAGAFLPPDAAHRTKEIIRYRIQAREKQAQREKELAFRMVDSDQKARKILVSSPWIDPQVVLADPAVLERQRAEVARVQRKRIAGHRWLVSLGVLLLLGAVVWRVRVVTEPGIK